jgi:RNA polymerase sigma-70 factor (ECF subfamily)
VAVAESPEDGWLLDLWRCAGDEDAARLIVERYVDRLVALARQRLSPRLARRFDPEDVLQSVFRTFFDRAKAGQFHLEGPDDLSKLLTRITIHKTLRQVAFHRAAKRNPDRETAHAEDEPQKLLELLDREPSPEEANVFVDLLDDFLSQLQTQDRQIIELRLQGQTNLEIADRLGVSERKVRRLMERIRGMAKLKGISS